jgi:hypothetical protein
MGGKSKRESFMTSIDWSLVEVASRLLERGEREAVLGDLAETSECAWDGLLDVLGLVIRRQAGLWKHWRPWIAAFGLALPFSFLLMGLSVSVSWTCQHLMDGNVFQATGLTPSLRLLPLICHVLLLVGCSWTGGLVVGSMSRRTLWVSVPATCSPCLFCLSTFRIESLSRFSLLLFLLPAIFGVRQGLRRTPIKLAPAIALAVVVTALMISVWSGSVAWFLNLALIWPAWYMVAAGRETRERDRMQLNTGKEEGTA